MPRDALEPPIASTDLMGFAFALAGARLVARPSGALWIPDLGLLAVADLHLGKAERLARRGGALLPPYADAETLERLDAEVAALDPETVLCAGDSFDDPTAARRLGPETRERLGGLAASRRWIWIAGNHDPAPHGFPGACVAAHSAGPLVFRHAPDSSARPGEVSGHLHPKATLALRGRRLRRRCFLADRRRVILPAFGAYTGGLDASDPVFDPLLGPEAQALLLGARVAAAPRAALSR